MIDVLPAYPQARGCPYQASRAGLHSPITKATLYDGREAWVVTGLAEARQVLVDTDAFSSDRQHPAYPALAPRFEAARKVRNFIGMDPPEHTAQRKPLITSFTVKRVNALRPAIQSVVDARLDALVAAGPGADLIPLFALPVPSIVISELLGVPYSDHAFFEHQSRRIAAGGSSAEESADAFRQLKTFLTDLIATKRTTPGDGLLDALITDQLEPGAITPDQLADLSLLLLVAGHETTASSLALGVLALLDHPTDITPATVAGVVEEILRYTSAVDGITRFAKHATTIAGTPIAEGDAVVVALAAANRDPNAFTDPDSFDPSRPNARQHLSFGFGPHQCIGHNLARAELDIALLSLFRRLPTLRLAVPPTALGVKEAGGVQGVDRLPVTW